MILNADDLICNKVAPNNKHIYYAMDKLDTDVKMEEYRFGIIYIKEENIVVTKDADELNKLFNYIPDDSNTYVDYSRELKDIPSKPIRMELIKK